MSPSDGEARAPVGSNPFAAALHRAIEVRGLSLERVQAKLAARGIAVSLTTLSFWRRGRSRPERERSLRAVTVLEELLGLPDGSLTALLGPPRPRGRFEDQPAAVTFDQVFDRHASLRHALAEFGVVASREVLNPDLTWLCLHDRYEFDEFGTVARLWVREIGRAVGPVDRCLVLYQADNPARPIGMLRAVGGCRRGRVVTDADSGFIVAELLFDRMLAPGDVVVFDHEMTFEPGGAAERRAGRGFTVPTSVYVLEVVFHPEAVPVRCFELAQSSVDAEPQVGREARIGAALTVTMAVQDVRDGIRALAWEWE